MTMLRRIFLIITTVLSVISASAQVEGETRADAIRRHLLTPGDGTVLVAAHRGDWRTAPENSLEAVESAIQMGADIVEIDIQRTLDGVLVLMHTPTMSPTTTGSGIIPLTSYKRLQKKYLRSGCRLTTRSKVPTLEEVMLLARGRVMLNLDKAFGYFDEIVALAEKTGTLDQIIFKSGKSPKKIEKVLGPYKDRVLVMPIVNITKDGAQKHIEEYLERLHPPMFEIIYRSDDDPRMNWVRETLRGKSRIWVNTLWDSLCGGHSDDRSFYDGPDAGFGYLIDTMEVGAIQTDRSALLIDYLRERDRRATPTPQKSYLWMQSLPSSTD